MEEGLSVPLLALKTVGANDRQGTQQPLQAGMSKQQILPQNLQKGT
jgi:hypothetical protein